MILKIKNSKTHSNKIMYNKIKFKQIIVNIWKMYNIY